MAGVHIVIDSCAAIPGGAAQDYSLSIVPQNVRVGDDQFHGGTDESGSGLIELLRSSQAPGRLFPPPVEDYQEVYESVLSWGVEVLSLHAPSELSRSVEVARAALAEIPGGERVTVVETQLCGPALGLAALRAAQAGIDDHPREAVHEMLRLVMPRIRMLAVAVDLDRLARQGGIDLPQAPTDESAAVLELREGRLACREMAANLGLALRAVASQVESSLGESTDWHLGAFSAGADAEAAALATYLDSRHAADEAWIAPGDPLLTTQLGPGAFGLAWYLE